MNEFAVAVGALASLAALAGLVLSVRRWIKQRRQMRELAVYLRRLMRLDRRLVALVTEAEARLTEGTGWYGYAVWPPDLDGHLIYLSGQVDDLERISAALRAFEGYGSVENLRQDLERLTAVMREATETYEHGIISQYRRSEGAEIHAAPTGRDPTPSLDPDHVEIVESLRREAQLLFRTALHRTHGDDIAERYETRWPTRHRAYGKTSEPRLWGGEPQPVGGLNLSFDHGGTQESCC